MNQAAKSCTILIACLAAAGIGFYFCTRAVCAVQFNQNCGGYLVRASHANTVELAEQQLGQAVAYMDSHDLKSGYTSVLWRTPDEDVGFWYANMTNSLAELRQIKPEASLLERSNVLIKLRESIIRHGDKGDSLIVPEGISVHPYNTPLAFLGVLSAVTICMCWWRLVSY